MKVVVKFVDFHWDNYQGGSGKSFEMTLSADVPEELKAKDFFEFIHNVMNEKIKRERPFQQDNRYSIQRIEIW